MQQRNVWIGLMGLGLVLTGCGGNKLDVTAYQSIEADRAKVDIPEACKAAYQNGIPSVAVVEFTNNSTFGKASVSTSKGNSQTDHSSVSAVGIGVTPVGVGAVGASKSTTKTKYDNEKTSRQVDAKVSESVTDAVESQIVELGGARIYSRTNLEKVMKEQRIQQSGLFNEDTLVQLGKMAGVKYIVTGAINNVSQKYIPKQETMETTDTGNKTLNQLQSLANLAIVANNIVLSGMTITTNLTMKVLDVETGEVLFSKQVEGTASIGDFANPSFDQLVGGLKAAAQEALVQANPEISKYFKVRGYIVKLKSSQDKRIAQMNIGSKIGVKEGQEFFVYSFEETEDPISGKISCDMTTLPLTLRASDQITEELSWATTDGQTMMLRIGQLVERKPVE